MTFIGCTGTCSSTNKMPLIHCKYPSHAKQNVCYPSFRVNLILFTSMNCTCWTPQPPDRCCSHMYSSLGTTSATTEKTHWHLVAKEDITDNTKLQMPLISYLCCTERCSTDWNGQMQQQLLQKRWSQWKIQRRLESTCTAADWYRTGMR